jgi:hypothetical protein
MQSHKKEIPFYKQTETGYCHPACVKMVLDFAIEDMGIKQRRMSLSSIARVLRTNKISGTIRENIELINAELEDSVPRIHFYSRVSARFDDIKDEIDSCRPVIAWINIAPSKEDTVMHAVVIVGYDLQQNEIFLVDPEMTQENHEKHMDLGMFLDEKLGVEGRIIILSVSEIGQKHLNGRITPYQRRRNS